MVNSVQRYLGDVPCFGSEVVVFGLRLCEQQMIPTVLRSFELELHIDVTTSSLNAEKGWVIAYDQDNSEWFVRFPDRGPQVCRLKAGNLASCDAIHFAKRTDIRGMAR